MYPGCRSIKAFAASHSARNASSLPAGTSKGLMRTTGGIGTLLLILLWSSLTLEALSWYIPNHDVSLVVRLNLHPLFRESQHSSLDRIDIVSPRNSFPPNDLVAWLQNCILRGSFQHSCHFPSTIYTRPMQDQTSPVYFPGKIRHGSHVATMGTPHIV